MSLVLRVTGSGILIPDQSSCRATWLSTSDPSLTRRTGSYLSLLLNPQSLMVRLPSLIIYLIIPMQAPRLTSLHYPHPNPSHLPSVLLLNEQKRSFTLQFPSLQRPRPLNAPVLFESAETLGFRPSLHFLVLLSDLRAHRLRDVSGQTHELIRDIGTRIMWRANIHGPGTAWTESYSMERC